MSAFEVSDTHIDILVSAALWPRYSETLNWYHDSKDEIPRTAPGEALPGHADYLASLEKTKRQVTSENAETWGATLRAENRRSVNHRYNEDEWEDPYVFTQYAGPFDPVAIIKAAHCYRYQACEHPEWEVSEAHDFIQALIEDMTHRLPGYGNAPWEVNDPAEATVGAAQKIRRIA